MRIGIDVGGTNTDAVLMDGQRVLAKVKTPTTPDVTSGIATALCQLREDQPGAHVDAVMVGTTHFVNAVLERRDLAPTAAVRLCLPAGQALPPTVDWPDELRVTIGSHAFLAHGGREFDGRPISPLDAAELRDIGRRIGERGIRQVAVTGIFSPVRPDDEEEAARHLLDVLPEADISLSHTIGRMSLLERENATLLNACLRPLARKTIEALTRALKDLELDVPLYLTQNDGTLMSSEYAAAFPVLTFASGPTNSMRGAAFLSGLRDGMVVDIGGTTTDVGALVAGFPREASVFVKIGGVRTNFRMPDVLSLGLGGGSLVSEDGGQVGPRSVAMRLTEEALCFGGKACVATDIAVASGVAEVGTHPVSLPASRIECARQRITAMLEEAIDRMKLISGDVPLILVGGGSILVGSNLKGTAEVVRPEHSEAANAVGAAISQISGEVDRVYELTKRIREDVLDEAKAEAVAKAVSAGARVDTVEVVEVEDVPLSYLPGNATRVRVKAVGNL